MGFGIGTLVRVLFVGPCPPFSRRCRTPGHMWLLLRQVLVPLK